MRSGKQKRALIKAKRHLQAEQGHQAHLQTEQLDLLALGTRPVDVSALAPFNSYGVPDYVERGYYQAVRFCCRDCGSEQIWTAEQQKWWYEGAKGYAYSTAVRCRACRQARRAAGKR